MSQISGVTQPQQRPSMALDQMAEFAKGLNINEKSQTLVKEVVGLLASERNVRVTNAPVNARTETGTVNGPTGTPALDNPDDPKAKEADLEKLLMYLQLENSEEQAKVAQERIESQKDNLAKTHKDRLEKIKETMDKMDEAANASIFSKIFGWLMAAIAVVVAVAACVATGGLALGPVIGAVLAVGCMVMTETGAMEDIMKGLAEALEKMGMSKQAAQIVAQVVIAVAILAASLACCGAGAASVVGNSASAAAKLAQTIQKAADIAMKVVGVGSVIAGGVSAAAHYKSGEAQADLTETTKILAMIRKQLEESEDELQKILEMIQGIYADIVNILGSETDTMKTIANQMSQMA